MRPTEDRSSPLPRASGALQGAEARGVRRLPKDVDRQDQKFVLRESEVDERDR
jgi:hypothetical protein